MAAKAIKTKKKLERAVVYLEPEQLRALRVEAAKRVQAAGTGRIDASAVVREIVAAWMVKHG